MKNLQPTLRQGGLVDAGILITGIERSNQANRLMNPSHPMGQGVST
jgi:hypothetical protein